MENELIFEAGTLVIRPGIISPGTYMIKKGRVRRESAGAFSSLNQGDFFGEEGAFINAPATYSIVAIEDTTVQLLDTGELFDTLMNDRDFLQRMVGKLVSGNWDTMHENRDEQTMFIFALLEQLLDQKESSGEIALAAVVEQLGLPEKMVVSVIEQIAFEEGSFLSLREDKILFSKEKINDFLSHRRVALFITACLQHNIDDQKGVGKFTLLQTALQNR